MTRLRRHRRLIGWCMIVLLFLVQTQGYGATLFWNPSGDATSPGDWDVGTPNSPWSTGLGSGGFVTWSNQPGDTAVFGDRSNGDAPSFVTLASPVTVGNIRFDAPGTNVSSFENSNVLTFSSGSPTITPT